jgi:primosomal protein N' (replication factor Y)
VVIQTTNPEHPVLGIVLRHHVSEFYSQEIDTRKSHLYPPFSRLIEITVKHTDKKITKELAHELCDRIIQQVYGIKVLGPGEPMVSKIRNQYLMNALIKIPRDTGNLPSIKNNLKQITEGLTHEKEYRSARIILDVDPV